jgi:guanylate kinase
MAAGRLIVLSAPSGAGKTSIARAILTRNPGMHFSVSATTRPRRPQEVEGRDYFFLDRSVFEERVRRGEFVEWEEVYGNLYGTLVSEVERVLRKGHGMLFDVDVKGALSIRRRYPEALLIFIAPPSLEVLEQRLRGRHTEEETAIRRRLEQASEEMTAAKRFDHVVMNDDLGVAIDRVDTIVKHHMSTQS